MAWLNFQYFDSESLRKVLLLVMINTDMVEFKIPLDRRFCVLVTVVGQYRRRTEIKGQMFRNRDGAGIEFDF